MDKARVLDLLQRREIRDVFYDERPVWIQELKDNIARVGFMDRDEEKDVFIEDLYERDLYNY